MAAGLEAARKGSTAPRSVRARIRTAVKRKAEELNVLVPELTDRIMKRIQQANALGSFADVDEVVDAANERAAAAEMLQRDSEYAGEVAPPLSEKEKQRYAAMDAGAPPSHRPAIKANATPSRTHAKRTSRRRCRHQVVTRKFLQAAKAGPPRKANAA